MPDETLRARRVWFPSLGVVTVEETDVGPLGPREVRVEAAVSLISPGTECANLTGPTWTMADGREAPRFPAGTGYSHTGRIVEIGERVTGWLAGDRIASRAQHVGLVNLALVGYEWRIPDGVSFEDATFTTLASTVLNAIRLGEPAIGEVAVVVGLGILGQLAVRFLRLSGVEQVIGIDLDPLRLQHAAEAVTLAVNPRETDPIQAVRDVSAGRGADVVYEVTGLIPTFNLCLDLARMHGRVVAMGSPRWPGEVDMMKHHLKAIRLIGAIGSSHPEHDRGPNRWTRAANGDYFLRRLAAERIEVRSLITHTFDAGDAPAAFAMLTAKSEPSLGVLLDWRDDRSDR